jgi:putative tricarboxylic transport membrane protein
VSRDFAFGGAAFALAVGYYLLAAAIPSSQLSDAVGPQGLPKMYAAVLAGLAILLMIRSVRRRPAPPRSMSAAEPGPDPRSQLWRVAGLLGIGFVYVAVVPALGYLVSIAALIAVTTYYQGGVVNRHVVAVALSGAVFLWLIFVVLLGIPQPPGWWPAFF